METLGVEMANLSVNPERNRTNADCRESYEIIYSALNIILLFSGFPTTLIVIGKLLSKMYGSGSVSAGEVFLLQINFTNVCLFASLFLLFLNDLHVDVDFDDALYVVFFSPTLTARPVFLLATCAIFYLAVAHPVTYMATKTWLRWEWLVSALVWIYASLVTAAVVFNRYDLFHPIYIAVFLVSVPVTMFLNVATLRALTSQGPRSGGPTFNPAKRKAFRVILSLQVALLLYYVPRTFFYVYYYLVPPDRDRFLCSEGPAVMMLPKISEFAMPVILLYSVRKLGV